MTDAEVDILIQKVLCGNNDAFDRLIRDFHASLYAYVRRFVKRHEDVEDVLQETFLNAYKAMRRGHYQHINAAAFSQWLRIIARHVVIYRNPPPKEPEPLVYTNADGEEVVREIPDSASTPEQETERQSLLEFLDDQLDEALIRSQSSQHDKDIGLLKKMAFIYFYVDQLSQTEVVAIISEYARHLGLAQRIAQTTINNWVSRGDILKLLIRHLVEQHRHLLGKLTDLCTVEASLTALEREILRRNWELNEDETAIAHETELPVTQVKETLRDAKRKVVEELFATIKKELHDFRHESDG